MAVSCTWPLSKGNKVHEAIFSVPVKLITVYAKPQAQHRLSDLGIHDDEFNAFVDKFGAKVDSEVNEKLVKARDSEFINTSCSGHSEG